MRNLHITRIMEPEPVRRIITAPEVYRHVSDDGSPTAAEYQPVMSEAIYYLGVYEGPSLLGVFIFIPQNCATVEVHTCLTRAAWGRSTEATALAAAWIWENTSYQRIVTNVPAYNRLARKLALCSGMAQFGTNIRSYLKGGRLYDQLLFGMNREAVCQ